MGDAFQQSMTIGRNWGEEGRSETEANEPEEKRQRHDNM